jgi:hypothetical protein
MGAREALMRHKWGRTIRVFFIFIVLFFVIALADLLIAGLVIGPQVGRISQAAQAQFPGKRIEALMAMVDCESCSLQDRNNAVWTLGQLDDPRALPVLENYFAGAKGYQPNSLSQDRLRIALRHLRHEDYNWIESASWRWRLPFEK